MRGLAKWTEYLFLFWLLTLPFHQYSIFGSYSADNLIAPLLLFLSFVFIGLRPKDGCFLSFGWLITLFLLLMIYIGGHIFSKFDEPALALLRTTKLVKDLLYFMLPIVVVRRLKFRDKVEAVVVVVTIIACISAFLAALDFYHPPSIRISPSRIGLDALPRAIGLFRAFGDMALLITFSTIVVVFVRKWSIIFKFTIGMALIGGILASQSRNVMLTLGTGILAFGILQWLAMAKKNVRIHRAVLLGLLIVVLGTALILSSNLWTETLMTWGGKQATITANQRLDQYQFALVQLKKSILFGVDAAKYSRLQPYIDFVHNLWLRELLQGGIFAVGALVAIIFIAIINGLRSMQVRGYEKRGAAYVGFILSLIISTQFNPSGTQVFWVLLGLVVSNATPNVSKSPSLNNCDESLIDATKKVSPDHVLEQNAGKL
jgi:hypothetical protein